MTPAQARTAMLGNVLRHILPNASELAGGTGTPEHLHQLRVGLRRLRTVLREFGPAGEDASEVAAGAARLFGALGAARDLDILATEWGPRLTRAGAPALTSVPAEASERATLLQAPASQRLWLEALCLTLPVHAAPGAPVSDPTSAERDGVEDAALRPWVRNRLWALHRRLVADAGKFERLEIEAQHRVRKRVKRLRYALELTAALHPRKAWPPYLDALRTAQDALGVLNDLWVAESAYLAQTETDPRAWLAVGWLRAQAERAVRRSAKALRRWARTPVGWERT